MILPPAKEGSGDLFMKYLYLTNKNGNVPHNSDSIDFDCPKYQHCLSGESAIH